MTNEQVEYACRAWLSVARREFVRRNPDKDWPHPAWDELALPDKIVFRRCIQAALIATLPKNVAEARLRDIDNASAPSN